MKITILCENASSDIGYLAEWGFSAFIRFNDINVLFDTGYSTVYLQNAKKLTCDLEDSDFIVSSHFHDDHTRGVQFHNFLSRKKVVCHPEVLEKLPKDEALVLRRDFDLLTSKSAVEFAPDIIFLGEIPRNTAFEKGGCKGDAMLDDSAIAIKTDKGVVIISGCAHAGICNICEYAKEVTGLPIYAVIGGFHLFEDDHEAVEATLDYFQKENPPHLYPMHCVDLPTLTKFHQRFGTKKYSAGHVISL